MKRRDLLTGLALASVEARAQTPATGPAAESLYIPKPQLVADRRFLHDFMDEFSFVDLVTVSPIAAHHSHSGLAGPKRRRLWNHPRPHLAPESAERDLRRQADGSRCFPRPARVHLANLVRQDRKPERTLCRT